MRRRMVNGVWLMEYGVCVCVLRSIENSYAYSMRIVYAYVVCVCSMRIVHAYVVCVCSMRIVYAYVVCVCGMRMLKDYSYA